MRKALIIFTIFFPIICTAHSGGTNQYGCHNQTSNNTYHCHSGPYNGLSFANQQAFLDYINPPATNNSPIVSIPSGSKIVNDSDGVGGETVTLVGSASDTDGSISSSFWKVGGVTVASGTIGTFFLADGTYTVTFQATDDDGSTSSTSVLVTIIAAATNAIADYDRDEWLPDWGDYDGDCINTRHEVLILESAIPVTMNDSGCSVVSGLWNDPISGQSFTQASDVDVDHLVALSEAHESGGYMWSTADKQAFANDLLRADALRAIDDGTNSSKSDKDPAEWLPPNSAYHCEYVRDWVEIKNAYGLSFDDAERAAIESVLGADISAGDRPKVTGIKEVPGDTSAVFRMGMTKNGECGFTTTASTGDLLNINISITPETDQLEQTVDIYIVASIGGGLFSVSNIGELIPFGGQIGDLVPFIQSHQLLESHEFTLLNGSLPDPISVEFFIAYLTAGGEFVYTPSPFQIDVLQ